MSIQQTGPGRFVVQVYRSDPLAQTPIRLCKRVHGLEAARKQEAIFEADAREWLGRRNLIRVANEKGLALATTSQAISVPDLPGYLEAHYAAWAERNLDPSTRRARAGTLMILSEDLAGIPLHRIEHEIDRLVTKWTEEGCRYTVEHDCLGRALNRKPRPISASGIRERLKVLRAVLGHAYMVDKLIATPARIPLNMIKRADPGAGEPIRYFTPEERARFLRYARKDMALVFQLAILTGMRPAELFHLLVGSVDFKHRKILVQACACPHCPEGRWVPKTGTFRTIDICSDLLPILRVMVKGKHDSATVIENRHGAPYSRLVGSGGVFTKTLRRAGLDRKGLSLYSTRHSFASDLVSAGHPIQAVAALLGNSPRVCEAHYGHMVPGAAAEAVRSLRAVEPWPTAQPAPALSNTHTADATMPTGVTGQTRVA